LGKNIHKFCTAKGKIIAEVELSISPDYRIIQSCFRTRPLSFSTLYRASKLFLNWSVEIGQVDHSNAGDLFTASNNFSNLKSEPAKKGWFCVCVCFLEATEAMI